MHASAKKEKSKKITFWLQKFLVKTSGFSDTEDFVEDQKLLGRRASLC